MTKPTSPIPRAEKSQQRACIEAHEAFSQMAGAAITPELARLLTEAMAVQARRQQNALKGALGQKAAAEKRHREWLMLAQQLIASRARPFDSYRDLARAVASKLQRESSEETIRKRLAGAGLLDCK